MADQGQETAPTEKGSAPPTEHIPNPAYPPQSAVDPGMTPYPQQPYPPQGPGVTGPTLEQPPPYSGPSQPGFQQPYPQPAYQQPGGVDPSMKVPLPEQQPNVVVVQNTPIQQPMCTSNFHFEYAPPPENHLVMSILSLFCCFIIGIVAIVYSSRVSTLWAQGLHAEARSSAAAARGLAIAAIVFGVVVIAINVIVRVAVASSY